jgi:hypothetical protein
MVSSRVHIAFWECHCPYCAYQRVDSPHAINSFYQFRLSRKDETSNQIFCTGRVDRRRRSCGLRDAVVGWRENNFGRRANLLCNGTSWRRARLLLYCVTVWALAPTPLTKSPRSTCRPAQSSKLYQSTFVFAPVILNGHTRMQPIYDSIHTTLNWSWQASDTALSVALASNPFLSFLMRWEMVLCERMLL